MPPCPSGSHIKPALEPLQWVLPEALCLATSAIPVWGEWLAAACSLMQPQLVRVNELCTSGPPPYPEIDITRLAEQGQAYVWQRNLSAFVWAAWVNANWALLCECLPVTGPGPCTPLAAQSGSVTGNVSSSFTTIGTYPMGHSWTSFTGQWITPTTNVGTFEHELELLDGAGASLTTLTGISQGVNSTITLPGLGGSLSAAVRDAVRQVRWKAHNVIATVATQTGTFAITAYAGPCSQDTTTTPPPPTPTPTPTPPTADPPPPLIPGSCTTDQLCQMLSQVLQQGVRNGQLLELLQRYGQPFGVLRSLVHGPYSGASSFAVSNLVGVQVDLQPPLPSRSLEGTPPYLWDAGWMSIMTADGMIEERRITRDTQVWQPHLMSEATTFGYFLKAGVTATFTELIPDPNGPAILLPPGTT